MKSVDTLIMDTTIRITDKTRDRLVEIGRKNESYDSCINRLIDEYGWLSEILTDEQWQMILGKRSGLIRDDRWKEIICNKSGKHWPYLNPYGDRFGDNP
jgi:predicted CopG family antitoxin